MLTHMPNIWKNGKDNNRDHKKYCVPNFPSLYVFSADSPPWRRDLYPHLKAPRTPAYNASEGQADKTKHVAQNPPLNAEAARWIDAHYRDRMRAVRGVDDMIELLVERLDKMGILDDTYVFFTSDHGYKLGEWRLGCSKQGQKFNMEILSECILHMSLAAQM